MSDPKVVEAILHCQKRIKKDGINDEKLLHYLGRLSRLEITVGDLSDTGIGRTVNSLSRNEGKVGQAAETLVRRWKLMVEQQQKQNGGGEEDESEGGESGSGSDSEGSSDESLHKSVEDDKESGDEFERESNGRDLYKEHNGSERGNYYKKRDERRSHSSRLDESINTVISNNKKSIYNTGQGEEKNYFKASESYKPSSKPSVNGHSTSSNGKSKSFTKEDKYSSSGTSFGDALGSLNDQSMKNKSGKHGSRRDEEPERKPVYYTPNTFCDNNAVSSQDSTNEAISNMLSNRNKNARSKVYSGVKSGRRGAVPTLFDLCMQNIKENVGALTYTYTMGISFDMLKPALERATPQQLIEIETLNDYLVGETDELWQFHCKRDFRGECPGELESWRELYERCKDGQRAKFEQIRKKMKRQLETAVPVRKAKLAYVESNSGPKFNRDKAQTIQNGMKSLKTMEEKGAKRGVASSASVGFNNPKASGDRKVVIQEASVVISHGSKAGHAPAPSISRERESVAKQKPRKAPLMQKTMKLIRSLNRR